MWYCQAAYCLSLQQRCCSLQVHQNDWNCPQFQTVCHEDHPSQLHHFHHRRHHSLHQTFQRSYHHCHLRRHLPVELSGQQSDVETYESVVHWRLCLATAAVTIIYTRLSDSKQHVTKCHSLGLNQKWAFNCCLKCKETAMTSCE